MAFLNLLRKIKFVVWVYHFGWALLGAVIYRFPSRGVFVIGVTGTKGKTTMLEVLSNILTANGERVAVLSSLYFRVGDNQEKNLTNNTMPGRIFVQKFLRRAVEAKCRYVLVEVTSEGVVLSRHRFVNWRMAVLTNLTPEHIESHGSFEKYREAKLIFLKYAFNKGAQIFLNRDDAIVDFFEKQFKDGEGSVKFFSKKDLIKLFSSIDKNLYLFSSDFNQENLAAAAIVAKNLDVSGKTICDVGVNFSGVPGRMEFIQKNPFHVVVDYAHTPASLEKIYENLKNLTKGKLICVLGSAGGGRDKWKRVEMGILAQKFCSDIILTNEDPYDEDPGKILSDVKSGIDGGKISEILDRGEAIRKAVKLAKAGDVVVITGKGSEPFIHTARGGRVAWSDSETAKKALKN